MTDFPEGQECVQDMINNILIEVLGSIVVEEEHRKIRRRQQEGISAALDKGIEFGRPKAAKPDNWVLIAQWQSGTISAAKAMELITTKKTTFYKLLKQQD